MSNNSPYDFEKCMKFLAQSGQLEAKCGPPPVDLVARYELLPFEAMTHVALFVAAIEGPLGPDLAFICCPKGVSDDYCSS